MKKTLIVSGGNIEKDFLYKIITKKKFDIIIASDRGLEILYKCNITPGYIIGDFDSINLQILDKYINNKNIVIKKLNPEKDYTDTHMALKLAIELKSTDITIIGAIGSRLDHTLANINILKEAIEKNITCTILNQNNKIALTNKNLTIKKEEEYPYISLIPLTTKVTGVTLKGFKYALNNATMRIGESIGVSNEQIEDKATIKLEEGILIIIQSKD